MLVKDIMTPTVFSVGPDAGVGEIAELLMEKKISAVPVLDDGGVLLGIVSEGDLIRRLSKEEDEDRPWWVLKMASQADDALEFIKAHGRTAREIMTRNVITLTEDTDLSEAAHMLESNRIKRAPVVANGEVVGIVSRSNLLQAVARKKAEPVPGPAPTDREIRNRVHDTLVNKGFASHGALNVFVENGVVELWGWVNSEAERDALLLAASEIEGVREVRDHFGRMKAWEWGT